MQAETAHTHDSQQPGHAARLRSVQGHTMIEALVVMGLLGVALISVSTKVDPARLQINKAQKVVISSLRIARTNAITKNVHFSVIFPQTDRLQVRRMLLSAGVWTVDAANVQTILLPSSTQFAAAAVGKTVEFSTRGLAVNLAAVLQINITDKFGATKSAQAWPSGQVNEL